jgi:hypothetical protein
MNTLRVWVTPPHKAPKTATTVAATLGQPPSPGKIENTRMGLIQEEPFFCKFNCFSIGGCYHTFSRFDICARDIFRQWIKLLGRN